MQNESAENPSDRFDKQKLIRTAFSNPFKGWRLYATAFSFVGFFLMHLFEMFDIVKYWWMFLMIAFFMLREIHDRIDAIAKLVGIEDDATRY